MAVVKERHTHTPYILLKAARLQIPADVHENFENVFKSKILLC
jgi:hypothetical protein